MKHTLRVPKCNLVAMISMQTLIGNLIPCGSSARLPGVGGFTGHILFRMQSSWRSPIFHRDEFSALNVNSKYFAAADIFFRPDGLHDILRERFP